MITIHHLGMSQSERIPWLCEELGIAYQLVRYDRAATGMAPDDYKALHPTGTAPIVTDDDLVLGESGAIVEYIDAKYGGNRLAVGPESPDFAAYLFWFHFANGSMMPAILINLLLPMFGGGSDHPALGMLTGRLDAAYALVEERLGQADYFAGKAFSAADIMMVFAVTTNRVFLPRELGRYPHLRRYLHRIAERPAYRTAMAKAEPGFTPMTT